VNGGGRSNENPAEGGSDVTVKIRLAEDGCHLPAGIWILAFTGITGKPLNGSQHTPVPAHSALVDVYGLLALGLTLARCSAAHHRPPVA
jgi:nitric oxide reductase large subunit